MILAITATIAFFPVYLLIREPFRRLPLHIDTGFYVSNHTIARKRLDFSKGWNAHYAGCSKVAPEVFYSLIYLLHGCQGYARWSRFYASVFNYATAMAVGLLACAVFGFDGKHFLAGLVAYALISSEPHWGGYFECGEFFHVFTDVASVLMLMHGIHHSDSLWVGAAAFTFAGGACFIKLSALIAVAVLFGGAVLARPVFILPAAAGGVAALMVFAAWVRWNGQSVRGLLGPLRGHEREFSQGNDWAGVAHRLREKSHTLYRAIKMQPWFVALAVMGLLFTPPNSLVFWLYSAGCLAAYVAQATDCRYYLIPLMPMFAVLAGGGALAILDLGIPGVLILCGVLIAWIFWNPLRAHRLPGRELNLWCWSGGLRAEEADRNFVLQRVCEELRGDLGSGSVLVYGPRSQAYALLGESYATPIVSAEVYLDQMVPGWQDDLNRQLIADSPEWILDTARCFRAREARNGLGLDYRMWKFGGDTLQVYERFAPLECRDVNVKTFAPLDLEALEAEMELAGERLTFTGGASGSALPDIPGLDYEAESDEMRTALVELLGRIRRAGHSRLAIYGAGRFTVRHVDIYRGCGIRIAMVLDDGAGPQPQRCGDWPIYSPERVDPSEFDAVVVSSDRFARRMIAKLRSRWGDRVAAFVIPGCR